MQTKSKKKIFFAHLGRSHRETFSDLVLKAGPGVEVGGVLHFGPGCFHS